MATRGMSVFTHQGVDYTINDPNIANEFSENTDYSEGEYVNYQGKLYKFISQHDRGTWNSSEVTLVLLSNEVKNKFDMKKIFRGEDFNEATDPGLYLTANDIEYANNPFPNGTPVMLEVNRATDYTTIIQFAYETKDYEAKMVSRMGRLNESTGVYRYTAWSSIANQPETVLTPVACMGAIYYNEDTQVFTVAATTSLEIGSDRKYITGKTVSIAGIERHAISYLAYDYTEDELVFYGKQEDYLENYINLALIAQIRFQTNTNPHIVDVVGAPIQSIDIAENKLVIAEAASVNEPTARTNSNVRMVSVDYGDIRNNLTWSQGAINNNTGEEETSSNHICSDFIETDEGDMFLIQYESLEPEYYCFSYYYTSEEQYIGCNINIRDPIWQDQDLTENILQIAPGKGKIRFAIMKNDSSEISPSIVPILQLTITRNVFNKQQKVLRVGTHNVRNWGTEFSRGYTGSYLNNSSAIKNIYKAADLDILGIQEYSSWIDNPHNNNAAHELANYFSNMYFATDKPYTPFCSAYELTDIQPLTFYTGRWGTVATLNVNDKTIKLYNVHFSPHDSYKRAIETSELLTYFANDDYFICTGDFNMYDFSAFTSAGYNVAFSGEIEQIITNMPIINKNKYKCYNTSDHSLMFADVCI